MRNLRTEEEMIANWKGDLDRPKVSICCITYNHESYIEDALKGFLIQETDFPFEILIHDDASTDRTADIIRKYEAKYPRLIKSIYQAENQYSKGLKIAPTFLFPIAKGEYIALCEGDDYWVSEKKLQIQTELMQKYADINISFHPAYKVDGFKLEKKKIYSNHGKALATFSLEDVILGGGGFMPTASLMIKSTTLKTLPRWFFEYAPVGDYYIQAVSSLPGGALYIPKVMGGYRVGNPNSWSSTQGKLAAEKIQLDAENHKCCINEFINHNVDSEVLKKAIGFQLTFAALKAMKSNNQKLARKLIKESLSVSKYRAFTQLIIYFFPALFKGTLFIKKCLTLKG